MIFHPYVLVVLSRHAAKTMKALQLSQASPSEVKNLIPPPLFASCQLSHMLIQKSLSGGLDFSICENVVFGIYLFKSKRTPLNILQFTIFNNFLDYLETIFSKNKLFICLGD